MFKLNQSTTLQPTVGLDTETGHVVTIGDIERCAGLYILAQPGPASPSTSFTSAFRYRKRLYGILFIDPHTDAITDLLTRIPSFRQQDVILLDPTDKRCSFGINLLHCATPTDPLEIDRTYGRVLDIFIKVLG